MILIDCNNLAHIAWHSIPESLSKGEQSTGVIFGFFNQIKNIAKKFQYNNLVFCFDSKISYRKQMNKDYKANRIKRHDKDYKSLYRQIDILKFEALNRFGFSNIFEQEGIEADDLIARICKSEKKFKKNIVSTDQDLYQLIDENTIIYNPISKKIIDLNAFQKKYLIGPELWPSVKAIAGCSSDNIIGVPGVGEKTAIKYLKNDLKFNSKKYKDIDSFDKINENMKLVKIPLKQTKKMKIKPNNFQKNDMIKLFNEYGFESFLNYFDDWSMFYGNC